ncbi:MAG: hypothetical protein CVU06_09520, partial [Bacteroidetes bacterium HGW-Bacteroidetes-22]
MMKSIVSFLCILLISLGAVKSQSDSLQIGLVANYPLGSDARDVGGKNHNGSFVAVASMANRFGEARKATHFEAKKGGYGSLTIPLDLNP